VVASERGAIGKGRLCWGWTILRIVSLRMPTTWAAGGQRQHDVDAERIEMKFRKACPGDPRATNGHCGKEASLVLAENETDLEKLGVQALKARRTLWQTMLPASEVRTGSFRTMPGRQSRDASGTRLRYKWWHRQSGLGSLGHSDL